MGTLVTVEVLVLVRVADVGVAILRQLWSLITTILSMLRFDRAAVANLMSAVAAVIVDWRVVVLMGVCAVCVVVDVHGRRSLSNDAACSLNNIRSVIGGRSCYDDALADDAILAGEVLHEFCLSPGNRSCGINGVGEGLVFNRASRGILVWVFHSVNDLSKWVELVANITADISIGVVANVTVLMEREGEVCSSVTRCRHGGEGSHDGCGVAWHLSDLDDVVVRLRVELADAVSGLVELGGNVGDLRWRVLLVRAPPSFWLLHGPWLVWVVRMLVWVMMMLLVVLLLVVVLLVVLLLVWLMMLLLMQVAYGLVSDRFAMAKSWEGGLGVPGLVRRLGGLRFPGLVGRLGGLGVPGLVRGLGGLVLWLGGLAPLLLLWLVPGLV